MGNYSKFFEGDIDSLATILAFDPGGTTGWCAMGVHPDVLAMGTSEGDEPTGIGERKPLYDCLYHVEYGQIDCDPPGTGLSQMHQGHPGLNLAGENKGVDTMVKLATLIFPKSAIVLEDFIPDMNRMDQARHTLSPIRITSAFSYGVFKNDMAFEADEGQGFSRIHVQNRALAKSTCTDARLSHWGLMDRNSGPHARDATRHAYYFLRDCRGSAVKAAENRWRAWPHLFDDPQAKVLRGNDRIVAKRSRSLGERI